MRSIYLVNLILLLLFYNSVFATDTIPSTIDESSLIKIDTCYLVFEKDTLFALHTGIGAFTTEDRVKAIEKRLNKITANNIHLSDSFNIQKLKEETLLYYKDNVLMTITENDVKIAGMSATQLADIYVDKIKTTFHNKIEIRSTYNWMISIGLTLLTLAGLIIIYFIINKLFKWMNTKLAYFERKVNRERKTIINYLMPKGSHRAFIWISKIIRYIILFLLTILYLPLLFRFLPWTQGIVQTFYNYLTEPFTLMLNSILDFLPDLFVIIVIFYVTKYVVRVLSFLGKEYEEGNLKIEGFHKDWARPTLNIIKVVIYAFALIFMFPYLPGSNSPAFQGVSIFLGLLLSLGSTSAIANIVAGIVITYMRPFTIGDRVRVGETMGDVIEKTLLVTKIRTVKNEDVTIPNATIINTHLWNFSKNAKGVGIILNTSVTIGYDVDWNTVSKLLVQAAKNTNLVEKKPEPFVLQKSLDDYYVAYEINAYTKNASKMQIIYSDLHRNILAAFRDANIEILSPMYIASRDGNTSTVPEQTPEIPKNPIEKIIGK